VTSHNNIHYFVGEGGVYSFDGTSVVKLSTPIDYWFADSVVLATGAATVFRTAVVDNRLYVTLPKRSSNPSFASQIVDYRIFVYDLDLKTWWKHDLCPVTPSQAKGSFQIERYEYSPTTLHSLFDGVFFGERLILVRDSLANAGSSRMSMYVFPSDDYHSDCCDTDSAAGSPSIFRAHYETAMAPLGTMFRRKSFNRLATFSSSLAASDSFVVKWYNENNSIVDSTIVNTGSAASDAFSNNRISASVVGDLVKYRIETYNTNRLKINAMEIQGISRGLGNE
jgi:hypothetical protein